MVSLLGPVWVIKFCLKWSLQKTKDNKSLAKEIKDLEHYSKKKHRKMETNVKNIENVKALKLGEEKSDQK